MKFPRDPRKNLYSNILTLEIWNFAQRSFISYQLGNLQHLGILIQLPRVKIDNSYVFLIIQFSAAPSKQAIKQKEKREARKARKAEERATGDTSPPAPAPSRPAFISTGDPEKDKKIKNINKVSCQN